MPQRRQKILYIINSLTMGGAERILAQTVKELSRDFEIWVLVLGHEEGAVNLRDEVSNYAHVVVRSIWPEASDNVIVKAYRGFWWKLMRYLWDELPASLSFLSATWGIPRCDYEIAYLEGRPTRILSGSTHKTSCHIAWVHYDMRSSLRANTFHSHELEQKAYEGCDYIASVSSDVVAAMCEVFGVESHFVQNVIDDKRIATLARESSPLEIRNRPSFIQIGRLEPVKGLDRTLEAARILHSEGYAFEVHVVGSGSQEEDLRRRITEYGLEDVVFLEGSLSNPYPALRESDYLVCSSHNEGFSGVVTEALLLGVPVITTDVSGMRDQLGACEYGIIVDSTVAGITDALRHACEHPDEKIYWAKRAQERGRAFRTHALVDNVKKALQDAWSIRTERLNRSEKPST